MFIMCKDVTPLDWWIRPSLNAILRFKNKTREELMKKRTFVGVMAAAITLGLVSFVLQRTSVGSNVKPSAIEVQVDNFSFGPETLTVPVNSAVIWVNKDDVPHTITSTDGLFKSKALDTDDKYSYTFTQPGTYSYYCSIHPKMMGKVVVR